MRGLSIGSVPECNRAVVVPCMCKSQRMPCWPVSRRLRRQLAVHFTALELFGATPLLSYEPVERDDRAGGAAHGRRGAGALESAPAPALEEEA